MNISHQRKSLIPIYLNELKTKGISYVLRSRIQKVGDVLSFQYYTRLKPKSLFQYRDKRYSYFYSKYNFTWKNERAIEIPIIYDIVKNNTNKSLLEVGNVLAHYFPTSHDVLDKYETAPGVINEDVIEFRPRRKYDFIVSISTLEHVGWDERPRDQHKFIDAVNNLSSLLKKRGVMVFTIPFGYNRDLDKLLNSQSLPVNEVYYMKRRTKDNLWEQVSFEEAKRTPYNKKFPNANAIAVCYIYIR